MPLTMVRAGETRKIERITGRDETRQFLHAIGFIEGENVTVIAEQFGNVILNIKNTRVALSSKMAKRVMV